MQKQQPSTQVYQDFKHWFTSNGGLFHKISFPHRFPPLNYIGVAASEAIKANQTFLAVPKKLIISVSRVRESELGSILKECQCLCDDSTEETEFNVLTLYLIWQKMQGKQSFFYPYLAAVEQAQTIINWPDSDILKIKDPHLSLQLVTQLRQQFHPVYKQLHQLSLNHPELFPTPISWQLFMECYALVMTRCFGWGLPETMMVPFGDFFNHNCGGVHHYIFNKGLESEEQGSQPYREQYVKKRREIDLTLLSIDNSKQLPISYQRNPRQKFVHEHQKYLTHQSLQSYNPEIRLHSKRTRALVNEILNSLLLHEYDLQTYPSSNSEDNDSEEEGDGDEQGDKQRNFSKQIKRMARQQLEPKFEEPKPMANSEFEDDTVFEWWHKYTQQQSYFIMSTQRHHEPGQQIFNSYGRRSNRFLLTWYGFTHFNNKYDSIPFRLFDQSTYERTGKLVYTRCVTEKEIVGKGLEDMNITDQFRLKRDCLCYELLVYLRLRVIRVRQPYKDLYQKKLLQLHKICNLELQKLVFEMYLHILTTLAQQYHINEQREKLSTQLHNYFTSLLVASNRQIITNHIEGVKLLTSILERAGKGQKLLDVYRSDIGVEGKQRDQYGAKGKGMFEQAKVERRKFVLGYVQMLGRYLDGRGKKKQ